MLATIVPLLVAAQLSAQPYREVEVCFVLDTTGSMSSLIESAKEKIWFIANEIVRAPSRPGVRFCLLGYRDRGDAYVTRHFDLTRDLDPIHAELLAFTADGGGDMPEAVNQALWESVENTTWSESDEVLKLVFLVGDAPPHEDYDEPQYPEIARRAQARGILINPVLVGSNREAEQAFTAIAQQAGGQPTRIDPNQTRETIETPMDQDLAVLGPRLDRLTIPYGPAHESERVAQLIDRSESMSHATASDRLSYRSGAGEWVDRVDLIEAIDSGSADPGALDPQWLPPSVRSMNQAELEQHLATVREDREALRNLIHALVEERRSFIAERRKGVGFESAISRLILEQLEESSP